MGKRGPAPKPDELKEVAANPGRKELNGSAPKFESGDFPPPDYLSEFAIKEWNRMCGQLTANGLLTVADLPAFAAYCESHATWVTAQTSLKRLRDNDHVFHGQLVKGSAKSLVVNPLIRVSENAMEMMVKIMKEFGMTPSSRTQVKGNKPDEENEFENLARSTVQ